MTSSERLAHYCSVFSVAEVSFTFRFPPTPQVCARLARQTPPGFRFDVRAWSLLSGAPTLPDSLWPDLQRSVPARFAGRRRLYLHHLPEQNQLECWRRFSHSLEPLRKAQRLGAVTFSYPRWFGPSLDHEQHLRTLRDRMEGSDVAVELSHPGWWEGERAEATLELLEDAGLALVCVDGPRQGPGQVPFVCAATSEAAFVRFVGRRAEPGQPWTWPYRYSEAELAPWAKRIQALAQAASEVHVLMDNRFGTDAVDNALMLSRMLDLGVDHRAMVADHPPTAGLTTATEDIEAGHGDATLVS